MYRHTYRAAAGEWTPKTHWHAFDGGEENTKRSLHGRWICSKAKRSFRFSKTVPISLSLASALETMVPKKLITALFSGSGTSKSFKSPTNPKKLRIASHLSVQRTLSALECGT